MIRSRPGFSTVHIDDAAPQAAMPARVTADTTPAIARHSRAKVSAPNSPLVQTAQPDYAKYEKLMQAKADAAFAKMQEEAAAKTSTELLPASEPSTPPITLPQSQHADDYT